MSGEDDESIPRRRMKHSRACDLCRRRKVCYVSGRLRCSGCADGQGVDICHSRWRCRRSYRLLGRGSQCKTCRKLSSSDRLGDASVVPGNRCSRCTAAGLDCQYNPVMKTSARPTKRYVEALEDRLKRMEGLVKKLYSNAQATEHPESDSSEGAPRPTSGAVSVGAMAVFSLPVPTSPSSTPLHPPPLNKLTEHDLHELDSSEDEAEVPMASVIGYHGKSSAKDLVFTLMDLKKGSIAEKRSFPQNHKHRVCIHPKPFELPIIAHGPEILPHSDFPEPDLMDRLVDAYFEHFNIYLPLLHRPSFEQDIERGLHFRDRSFGSVVLLVCANGAIWTEDSRIRSPEPGLSPGWEWFDQVGHEQWSLLTRPKLHDLQACALMAAYMSSSHTPQSNWMILTLGIRMALDAGAHRKKKYTRMPMIEQELWRRAFWVLVAMDRMSSFALGRPCAIHEEDFDVDPLTECDDEYWANPDPALAFKQPAGRPSKIALANCFIRLLMILAFASRTIYTINKSKLLLGFVGAEWKQNIVAEIDSALNRWRDSVPAHLRWDPYREDLTFFKQSAFLYIHFYQIQIFIHRQFIPSPRRPPPSHQLPSLTICVSAARACMEVVDAQWKRTGVANCALNPLHAVLFTACVILLMNLWSGTHSGKEADAIVEDVRKCVNIMKELEVSNQGAKKIRAVLTALMTFTPSKPTPPGQKAQPSDLGDLVTAAMESLRLSLTDDPQGEEEQFEEMLRTCHTHHSMLAKASPESTSSPFATASSSTATPVVGEMSAFYDSPQKDPQFPTASISEDHSASDSSPSTQQPSSPPSVFLPSSYRGGTSPAPVEFAPAATSDALHESLSVRGPDGMMDFAMSCGDSLLETLVECLQEKDGASAGTYPPPEPLYYPQAPVVPDGVPVYPEPDFSSWLAGELGSDAPWAMPSTQNPVSPRGGIDWDAYLQMMGPLPGGDPTRPGY